MSSRASTIKKGKLTDPQIKFCLEYIKDFNATQAAIRAGYSPKTAVVQASRLLSKANIQEYIQQRAQKIEEKSEIDLAMVLKEFGRIAFTDVRKLFNDDGTLKDIKELDPDLSAAISSIEVYEEYVGTGNKRKFIGYTKKIKFWDKKGSLDSIGKYLGMFKELHEHTGKNGGPIETINKIDVSSLSKEERDLLIKTLRKNGANA